jgi:AAA family ATP:ADP antiporter
MRINAVEFLDNLLETNLKRVLVPIVETALLDNISEDALKSLNLKIPDEFHCLSMLLSGPDVKISLATLFLISQIKDKKYIPLVANFTQSENLKIKTFANQALIELLK